MGIDTDLSETGWVEFSCFLCYLKMVAARVSRFLTAGQGERRLWERDWHWTPKACKCLFFFLYFLNSWSAGFA